MKYLAILAIALFGAFVAAEPEADAEAGYYGRYGYGGYGYGYGLRPYARGYYGGYGYGYPRYGYHGLWKRSADADADAEAGYYGRYGYGGYGYGYGLRPYARGYYGGYGYGYPSYGYRHLYKREAEADAHHPLALAPVHAYAAYPHHFYRPAVAESYQHVSTPVSSYGLRQLHKREADSDAEAGYYGRYGYGGYGYGGYGYGYPRYGYRHGFYGYPYRYGHGYYY